MELYCGDCLDYFKRIPTGSVDLIVTDPPYQIDSTKGGGGIGRKMALSQGELESVNITSGFDSRVLDEMLRVCKTPNVYIWCNGKQIPMYLDFFVRKHGCNFDILVWVKTNAVPTFSNKYLVDKEYCLYFRRGGVLQTYGLRARKNCLVPADKPQGQEAVRASHDKASEYHYHHSGQ